MIRFSKYIWLYMLISALVLVPGIYTLVRYGLRPAIDFTGGSLLELRFSESISAGTLEDALNAGGITSAIVQDAGQGSFLVRLKPEDIANSANLQMAVASVAGTTQPPSVVRNETVGPVLGKELLRKTVTAAIFAIAAILLYVAYAFRNIKFGVSAIVALVHDLLVVLGVFAILGRWLHVEVDTLFVTAFLTTMSFSVHDTIVVFDRIREMSKKGERISFESLADKALTETIGRSLTNSLTIIFMLLALVLMGGENTRWFVMALLVGTVSGTYSSPFIATPVLILWDRWERRRKKIL
jgi:preprotein translocase subunit SecF